MPVSHMSMIRRPVFAAERLHGDETTVLVLARNKTATGRSRTCVRGDRPFGGPEPPAAICYLLAQPRMASIPPVILAGYAGLLQADACAGFGDLYEPPTRPMRQRVGSTVDATSPSSATGVSVPPASARKKAAAR